MNKLQLDEEAIFQTAREMADRAARGCYLDEVCDQDQRLRRRIEWLLEADEKQDGFLKSAVGYSPTTAPASETLGQQIGPYKLLEQIGEGGMGVVYVAEQTEPVRRRVALKIIKPGMDTKQVIARFEAERQALAMMDHPNIAKIFDAGTVGQSTKSQASSIKQIRSTNYKAPNESGHPLSNIGPSDLEIVCDLELGHCDLTAGRPYFVMELVRGLPITDYCDQVRLSPRQRLALFIDVCQAIQHAHQKGIIHRDLKPSNVMVTLSDGRPVVKVIDFGVAKAVGQQLTERTIYTAHTQLVGTPLYMSPEQAELSSHDVDTRSDVYSLGVLLYELLTGQTPFDKERLKAVTFDEMRRIIREEEPETVSARIAKTRRVGSAHQSSRQTPSAVYPIHPSSFRLHPFAELDWIVMKALEKDRARRFESASSLAADIQRFLSDEPVLACPPTTMYRFQKFARKHKPALVTAAAIALCLVLGTTVSAWQAVRATTAEAQANANATQAQEKTKEATEQRNEAQQQRDEAQRQRDEVKALADKLAAKEQQLQRTLYAAEMNLAHNAWGTGGVGRVVGILARHRPQAGETDLRSFEWHYLNRLCHGDLLTFKGHTADVLGVAFSPDGKHLVSGGSGGVVKVWDAQTGQVTLTLKRHGTWIRSVAYSPDAKRLASLSNDKTLKVWDAKTGQELLSFDGVGSGLASTVVFSPDSKRLASGFGQIKVWDAQTGQELLTLKGGSGSVVFSPDGKRIATGGNQVRVWDAVTGRELLAIKGGGATVAFSPDGKRLAGARRTGGEGVGKGNVHVWDAETGQELLTLKGNTREGLSSLAFSPDGRRLAGGSWDETIEVWDVQTGELLATLKGHTGPIDTVAFSPDGQRLASSSRDITVKVWNVQELTSQETLTHRGGANRVWAVAFSPDGKRLASASLYGERVRVWDAQSGQDLLVLEGHTGPVWGVAFSPNGKRVASASYDKTVKVWDAQTGQDLRTLNGHTDAVLGVAFSPDGKRLASASEDNTVKVWNVETGEAAVTLTGLPKRGVAMGRTSWPTRNVVFSPDGTRVASGFEGQTNIWDAQTGQVLQTLKLGRAEVINVAFSPDGKRVASGGGNEIKVWDAQTGQEFLTLTGHTRPISSVVFSPDGHRVASGAYDGTVKVWNAQTGHDTLTLTGHVHRVCNVVFSPDGHRLASNGPDGSVLIWDATPLPEKPQ